MLGATITSFTDDINVKTGEIVPGEPVTTRYTANAPLESQQPKTSSGTPAKVCGGDCSWFQTGVIGTDGECACAFSPTNALTTAFLAPGSFLMGLMNKEEASAPLTQANTTMITLVSLAAWSGAAYLYWRYKR